MPKHAFFYPSRITCAKIISPGYHCICRLVSPSTCRCISRWICILTYRVQAVFSGNGRALYVPYVTCPWASKIFYQTSPRSGRHLACQCWSRSFVRWVGCLYIFTQSHPLYNLFDYLWQSILEFYLYSAFIWLLSAGLATRMSAAAPIQVNRIIQVHRKCWPNRLYQIWSRWRLLDPIGLQPCSLHGRVCSIAWTRYYAQKAMAVALGAVVDLDNGSAQAV